MNFLPNNKWIGLLCFILLMVAIVVVALSLVKIKPDTKNIGGFRFTLGGKKQTAAGTK
jgi:hypothetical protein